MRTPRARALPLLGIVGIIAMSLLAPVSGTASPAATDNPITRASMDYLIATFGVTEAEARRRLDLQDRVDDLVKPVRDAVGDELHDVQIDQAGGGKLRFLTSRPAQARAALGAAASEVVVEPSRYTVGQLRAAETEVRARLAGLPGVEVAADPANQRVSVRYGGADRTVGGRAHAAGTQTGHGIPVAVDTTPETAGQQRACGILSCDPPMRGGVRLHVRRDDGSWGSCTAGFNIRGSNGWVYMLTAGHCVLGDDKLKRQYLFHNGLPVVWELHASGSNTDPNSPPDLRYVKNNHPNLDYAVLPYQLQPNGRGWHRYWIDDRRSHNLVQASCVAPSNQTCANGEFAMTSLRLWADMTVGTVVCATGTGTAAVYPKTNSGYRPGTRCGTIQAKNMWSYYSVGSGGKGIKVDICSRPGDSGGPLFDRSGRAYGILSGGPERTGACNLSDPLDYSVYSPLEHDLRDVSSRTGITMSLITTSGG